MKNLIRFKKPTEYYFRKSIKDIDKNSRDITCDYKYKEALGLAFTNNYGEQARECFHIICKPNVNYNKVKCDKEYTEYLKIKDNNTTLADYYRLYISDLSRRNDELMKEFEKGNNAKKQNK